MNVVLQIRTQYFLGNVLVNIFVAQQSNCRHTSLLSRRHTGLTALIRNAVSVHACRTSKVNDSSLNSTFAARSKVRRKGLELILF